MQGGWQVRPWAWAGVLALAAGWIVPVEGQSPDDLKREVARISVVEGDASVQRGDSQDWVAASVNAPVMAKISVNDSGETKVTARGGEVEVFTPRGSQWVRSGQSLVARGALAPYEVLHPWWGRSFSSGRPYLNRTFNILNVSITNTYRNTQVWNGYTVIRATDFRSGRFGNRVRPAGEELRNVSLVRGAVPIVPNRSNLQPAGRPAAFVPRPQAPTRFFRHEEPNPAARAPFAAGSQPANLTSRNAVSGAFSRNRFGAPGTVSAAPGGTSPVARSNPGWRRVQEPGAVSPAAPRGWNRFGAFTGPRASVPREVPQALGYRGAAPSDVVQLRAAKPSPRVTPPAVRQGASAPGGSSGSQRGGQRR